MVFLLNAGRLAYACCVYFRFVCFRCLFTFSISGKSNDVLTLKHLCTCVVRCVVFVQFVIEEVIVAAMSGSETNPFADPNADPFSVSYTELRTAGGLVK